MRTLFVHFFANIFVMRRDHHKTLNVWACVRIYVRVCVRIFVLPLFIGATLSACQKADPIQTTADRLKSVEQNQQINPDFYAPRKNVDYMGDLKNIKDAPAKPEPAPIKTVAETKTAPAPVAAAPVPAPVQPTPAPVRVAEPTPAAQVAAAVPVRPAAPKAEPPTPTAVVTPTFRAQPEFPRDAIRQSVDSGTVRARVTISANGDVTNVTIIESRPLRLFDRAVTTSLSLWKFNPGADGRTYTTEINFQR